MPINGGNHRDLNEWRNDCLTVCWISAIVHQRIGIPFLTVHRIWKKNRKERSNVGLSHLTWTCFCEDCPKKNRESIIHWLIAKSQGSAVKVVERIWKVYCVGQAFDIQLCCMQNSSQSCSPDSNYIKEIDVGMSQTGCLNAPKCLSLCENFFLCSSANDITQHFTICL